MCDSLGSFEGFALVPSKESQLTPWAIVGTALVLNMVILYPTHRWNKFSLISALWSLISGLISLWRVVAAVQGPMTIAYNMPFSLPLGIGTSVIRLTLEDGTQGFKQRWRTLFAVVRGESPEYAQSMTMKSSSRVYHRIEEILRFTALVIDSITMTAGLIRVWLWWFPLDAMSDSMCLANFTKNVHASYDDTTCATTITDWSSATYSNCVQFEPAVGWFLIIVYTAIYVSLLVGIIVMRGYVVWAIGIVGSAILIVLSGLQSTYSTQGLCVKFVATLMGLSPLPKQVLSHQSLINLWWYRSSFRQWLVQLFTIHG